MGTKVAKTLVRKGHLEGPVRAKGLLGDLRAIGITESVAEDWLHRFLEAGWLRLAWDVRGPIRKLAEVVAERFDELEEYGWPGRRRDVHQALQDAQLVTAALSHPIAKEIGHLLEAPEFRAQPALIRALTAVATHVDRGDVLAARVFSSRYLGDSKALEGIQGILERALGPLEDLGIRRGATLCLLGGEGTIILNGSAILLKGAGPFIGLTTEALEKADRVNFPSGGLLVVENLTVFDACCRLEAGDCENTMVVWSGGYPGRAVRGVVAAGLESGRRVRVWADLDLDGVRISRLLEPAEPYRMEPGEFELARVRRTLTPRAREAIRAELAERPTALLAGTLQVLLARDSWIEQEALL